MGHHESCFTYATQHPYPFKWYTGVTLLLGAIALVACTLINIMATGFNVATILTENPLNQTDMGTVAWLSPAIAFLNPNLQTSCQPVHIPVGSQVLFQRAFWYILSDVALFQNGVWQPQTGLQYMFDEVDDCELDNLVVNIQGQDQASQQLTWTSWNPSARAHVYCNITAKPKDQFRQKGSLKDTVQADYGVWRVNLTVQYSYVPEDTVSFPWAPTDLGLYHFALEGAGSQASLTWGCSLTSMYWAYLSFSLAPLDNPNSTSKGALFFQRNQDEQDITSLDFFDVAISSFPNKVLGIDNTDFSGERLTIATLAGQKQFQQYPNIWIPVDSFVKSFYSSILSDLGVPGSSNLLADGSKLSYFTQNFTDMLTELDGVSNTLPGPITVPYLSDSSLPVIGNINRTTITTEFTCQVPTQKTTYEIVINVLVQDMVMMRALYALWTMLVGKFCLGKRKMLGHSMYGFVPVLPMMDDSEKSAARGDAHTMGTQEEESGKTGFWHTIKTRHAG